MTGRPVVIDTNILFSCLLKNQSEFTRLIFGTPNTFYICESVIIEMFKHKERILALSRLHEADIVRLFYTLLRNITVYREVLIPPSIRQSAYELCKHTDPADSPQVALTIHLNGVLWTGDKKLKKALLLKGFHSFFEAEAE
ncbi:MAG: PIN domain-containing protein [Desulfococcaceae bacterium]